MTYGSSVRSWRNGVVGVVVGFGTLQWPWPDGDTIEGDTTPQLVYLVKLKDGSSSLGPACAVFRADQVTEVEPYKGTPGGYIDP